jgi:hypothetical protein
MAWAKWPSHARFFCLTAWDESLVLKGHGLQAAEKLSVLKGHDFSRAVNGDMKRRALAPEERFSAG